MHQVINTWQLTQVGGYWYIYLTVRTGNISLELSPSEFSRFTHGKWTSKNARRFRTFKMAYETIKPFASRNRTRITVANAEAIVGIRSYLKLKERKGK